MLLLYVLSLFSLIVADRQVHAAAEQRVDDGRQDGLSFIIIISIITIIINTTSTIIIITIIIMIMTYI